MCHHHPSFVDLSEEVGCVPPPLHHHYPSLGGKGVMCVCVCLYLVLLSLFKDRYYGGMKFNVRETEGAFMGTEL